MKKSQIVFSLFLPSHQDASGAIEPGVSAFHYPAPRSISCNGFFLPKLLAASTDMWPIRASQQFSIDGSRVVGRIQTQMLGLLQARFWSVDDQAIQSSAQQFH